MEPTQELSPATLIAQTYGFAMATALAALLLVLVKRSGGTDRRARCLFGACLLIANGTGLAKNLAYVLSHPIIANLGLPIRAAGFIAAAFVPLSIVSIWKANAAPQIQNVVGRWLSGYALLSGLFIASGLILQASFPVLVRAHHWLEFFADQDRVGNLTFYNGLLVAGIGAATLLPGKLQDLTLRIAVSLILLGLCISSVGAFFQSRSGVPEHTHHLYNLFRFQGIGLVVLGALLYFSRFRAADIFAKEAMPILLASSLGIGTAIVSATILKRFALRCFSPESVQVLGGTTLVVASIALYSETSRWTDLFVERFIFKKRDARIAIAKFRDKLATVGDRGLVLAGAIDLSNELLSSRVQAIRFDDEGAISDLKADFSIPVPGNGNRLALTITFPEHRGFLLTGEASALSDIAQHVGRRLTELDREEERMQTILQESRLKQSVVESELRALCAQVNPHFLFNSLNTIAALISDEPAVAETITVRLASIFRHVLLQADRPLCKFIDEITFLKAYLGIEQIRFGERLEVVFQVDGGLYEAVIPSLILQPLVENAIKHAVTPKVGRSHLKIEGRRRGEQLAISVEDDGAGSKSSLVRPTTGNERSTGVGLKNIRERLAVMYGPSAQLSFVEVPGGGSRFTIEIPWRK
jgi:two-component system, LytTR family, sensor kinase